MRILICDDQERDNTLLFNIVQKYCYLNKFNVDIYTYTNSVDLLNEFNPNESSIIFLDIFINDGNNMNGIDIAKKIREVDSSCIIIFTTMSDNYALDAFSVHALDYLVKPIEYENIEKTLNRCFTLISQPVKYIKVLSNRLNIKIVQKNILYVEVFNKYCMIHTTTDSIKTYMTLSEIQKLLDSNLFLRCHRSFIVNLDHIHSFSENDFILKNENVVPIAKDKKAIIKQIYLDYLFELTRS